jgi:hypothetical protein
MAGYDWQTIFKSKSEKELIEIYGGNSQLNFGAEIFAGLELKNRNYDFKKIIEVHKKKTEELRSEISDFETLEFRDSKYFKDFIKHSIGLVVFVIILIAKNKQIEAAGIAYCYQFAFYIIISLFIVLTAKWKFERFKKNKEKTIVEKTELLKKITTPS